MSRGLEYVFAFSLGSISASLFWIALKMNRVVRELRKMNGRHV